MSSSQASTSSDFELLGSQEVFSQLSCCQDQSQDSQPRRKSTDDVDFPITSKENPQVEVTPSPNTGDANSVLVPVMAVPRGRSKRRFSILKPQTRLVLQVSNSLVEYNLQSIISFMQDLNPKKRRVSFSQNRQVKEFQAGQENLTEWNTTYEQEMSELQSCSNGSSGSLTTGTPTAASAPVSNRVEQIQVCS